MKNLISFRTSWIRPSRGRHTAALPPLVWPWALTIWHGSGTTRFCSNKRRSRAPACRTAACPGSPTSANLAENVGMLLGTPKQELPYLLWAASAAKSARDALCFFPKREFSSPVPMPTSCRASHPQGFGHRWHLNTSPELRASRQSRR